MALLRRPVAVARLCVRIAAVLGRVRNALVESLHTGSGLLALAGNSPAGYFLDVPAPPQWRAGLEPVCAVFGSGCARRLGSPTHHPGVHQVRAIGTELVADPAPGRAVAAGAAIIDVAGRAARGGDRIRQGYVENEQMRLGERLQVRWDVEPEALEARVPSLIL
jgi:hypothetical protein